MNKKQREFAEEVSNMNNQVLYDEYVALLPGDDYDGMMTNEGSIRLSILQKEFESRIQNWLNINGVSKVQCT